MKKSIIFLLVLGTSLIHAQRKPKIKGNRSVTEVQAALEDFHAVTLLDNLEISLEKGAAPGYVVTADDNLIDILKFEVVSDTLFISSYYTVTAKKQLDIKVVYRDLSALTVREGSITSKGILSSEVLQVRAEGVSKVQLHASAPFLTLELETQSSGDFNLESDSLRIAVKDRADARIYQVSSHLSLDLSGTSDVQLEGTSEHMQLALHDRSSLKAERMEASVIQATLFDAGSAYIKATSLLELSSHGSGSTYLYGDPQITITEFMDTSKLYKRTE